ncbi:MAG: zinc-ribbon domain-containing protein [Rhizobiales bacterium]|nr:zinc-ribbon domain-containing protein [Hyphomicrobiales bacterium]
MILTCPECTTSYEADDALLGPTGRKVKCHNCGNIWMVIRDAPVEDVAVEDIVVESKPGIEPDFDDLIIRDVESDKNLVPEDDPEVEAASAEMQSEPVSEPEPAPAPDFAPDSDDFGEAVEGPDAEISLETSEKEKMQTPDMDTGAEDFKTVTADIEKLASREQARSRNPDPTLVLPISKIRRFAAIAAAILLVVAGLVMFQTPIVRHAPGMARLYALVGINVNLRGLEFRDIAYARAYEDGLTVLTVRGEIVNITDAPVQLPMIRFSLRNDREQEIYHWSGSAGRELLLPSGAVPFETRLASPPAAQEILVQFAR